MNGPSNRRPTPPRRSPASPKPAAVKRVARQPGKPVARPAARSFVPVVKPASSGAGAGVTVAMLLAFAGAGYWWFALRPAPAVEKAKPVAATKPIPVQATPAPVIPPPQPIAAAPVEPAPMAFEPVPMRPEPAPKPVAAAPAAPDAFSQPANFNEVAGKSPANLARTEAALNAAFTEGKWTEYRDWLRAGLASELKRMTDFAQPQSYDRVLKNPLFYQALLQHTLLDRLPSDARASLSGDPGSRFFFNWLLTTPDAAESLLENLRPEDNAREVLRVWARLAAEDDDARGKYRQLALAIALVFDQPFRPRWNEQTLEITPRERWEYYKTANQKGELQTHLDRYRASNLVWVVADPVPMSEIDWARKKVHLRQRNWGDAYGMVKYDMQKAVTGQMKSDYDTYTFSEILEKGGVCGDRAYFAAYTARANGIPAAIIGGDGPLGGHAWIRWMPDDDQWAEAGRIGGYAAGTTTDPQTGRSISEQEFVRRSDPREAGVQRTLTALKFLWLADLHGALGETTKVDATIDFSLKTSPRLSAAWEGKLAHWRAHHRDDAVTAWDSVVSDLKKRFADDKVMLAEARKLEEEFIFPRQDMRDSLHDLKKDAKKFKDPRTTEAAKDVGQLAGTIKREAQLLADAKQFDSLHQLYRRALTENAANTAAWKPMAQDYFAFFKSEAASEREKAARQIEYTYERGVETPTQGWFEVNSQNSARAIVAECWKECGDAEKADRIAKEIERRTKRSKREAL